MKKSILLLALALLPALAHAQGFAIDWFTIDGGGGTSTAGGYSLSGTIGQPDTGVLTNGPYVLTGGFWGVVSAIQTPGAPLLSVTNAGGTVIISWPRPADHFVLDQTGTLASPPAAIPWLQVAFPYQTNATHIFTTVPAPAGNRVYRLRKP